MMAVIFPKIGHVMCSNDTQNIFLAAFFKDCTLRPLKGSMQSAARHEKMCQKTKYLINRSAFIVAVVK